MLVLPGRGAGSEHMDQILSYTRRPGATRAVLSKLYTKYTTHKHNIVRFCSFTERVEDVGDEDELAGVEQDHRCV